MARLVHPERSLSEFTIAAHLNNIYRKLNITSKRELAYYAMRDQFLDDKEPRTFDSMVIHP